MAAAAGTLGETEMTADRHWNVPITEHPVRTVYPVRVGTVALTTANEKRGITTSADIRHGS